MRLPRAVVLLAIGLLTAAGGCEWDGGEPGRVGERLPSLRLLDLHGNTASLAPQSATGMVINVWATWCRPCREEMASLNALHASLDHEQVVLFGIAVDDDPRLLDEYLRRSPVAFPVLVDPGMRALKAALGVRAVPETIVVGSDGRIKARVKGSRDWSSPQARALVVASTDHAPRAP